MPIQDRLYAEASKYHEREKLKREVEEKKANAFPFRP